MVRLWRKLNLRQRFMIVVSLGVSLLVALAVVLTIRYETAAIALHAMADDFESTVTAKVSEFDGVSASVRDLTKTSTLAWAGTVRVIWSAQSLVAVVNALEGEAERFVTRVRQ